MRSLFITVLIAFATLACKAQADLQHRHFIDDMAGLYTTEQANDLANSVKSFWDTAQIAVVTVKSLDGREIQEYATALFNQWGIGDREKNNGLLFLIAPTEHKAWAATGRGIQGYLTDIQAAKIQREYLVPEAKKGNYYAGTKATLNAYIDVLRPMATEVKIPETESDGEYMWMLIPGIFLSGFGILLIVLRRRRKRREAEELERQRLADQANSGRMAKLAYGGRSVGSGGYSSGGYVGSGMSTPAESYTPPTISNYESSYTPPSDNNNTNDNNFSFGGGNNDGGGGGSEW